MLGRTTWELSVADLSELLGRMPAPLLDAVRATFAGIAGISVAVLLVGVLVRRRWVGAWSAAVAAVLAAGVAAVGVVAGLVVVDETAARTAVGIALDPRLVAAAAGALTVARPWLPRRWRWACPTLLVLYVPVLLIAGGTELASLLVTLGLGNLVGAVVLLAVRSPSCLLPLDAVLDELTSRGLEVEAVRLDPPARGPFVAHVELAKDEWSGTGTAHRLRLEVLSDDDRTADALARLRRLVTLRRPGDTVPFSSLRRAVEHEALVALAAERAGVVTPGRMLVGQPTASWMMLGTTEPVGTPLTALFPDATARRRRRKAAPAAAATPDGVDAIVPTPSAEELLDQLWDDIATLRRARVAHRAVRPAALAVRDDGRLVLTDFRSGQIAAPDAQLDLDLAQGLYTAALVAGAEAAVRTAVARLGPDLVVRGAQGLGPVVVPREARGPKHARDALIEDVRLEVERQCDVQAVQTYQLSRFSRRQLVQLVLLVGLTYVALPLVGQLPRTIEAVRTANPVWAAVALVIAAFGPVAAALSLRSCTTAQLPLGRTVAVQVATSFVGTSTPASVGSLALNARYLTQTGGLPIAAASGVIALQSVVQVVTHVGLLAILAVVAGQTLDLSHLVPGKSLVLLVIALLLAVVGVVLAVPRLRRTVLTQARMRLREVVVELGSLARRPGRLALAVVGSCGVTLASAAALWACLLAFGGGNKFVAAAFVTMVGATLATAAPTPGGVGAVEAALIGGLAAFGVPSEVAVPTAFFYRFLTCWLPVLAGWFVLRWLQRRRYV
ncbi:integral membrane protein [Luteimicrobium album]|uniref:Integral membrane protein n=1 Tax=Luteimicrobium album TaxID=1054550 RepID=A0ABQ6HYK4_9MICO|nr:lysylphosphatidylglycerol synthase transmembrane domain-containing protein [Luteimicrobium album]GMA22953.1 integral membrane protein [Luteimicrobium album]